MPNLLVVSEDRIHRGPDGHYYAEGAGGYETWERLFASFDRVTLCVRSRDVSGVRPGVVRVEGPQLRVAPLPYYVGPRHFLPLRARIRELIAAEIPRHDALLARMPGILSYQLVTLARRTGRGYGLEVVGDPIDVFSGHSSNHPLRAVFRALFAWQLRDAARGARGVVYVSGGPMRARYQTDAPWEVASDVNLPDEAYAAAPRTHSSGPHGIALIGSLDQPYKGVHVLLRAYSKLPAVLRARTMLHFIGGGRLQSDYKALAEELGVATSVEWHGVLASGASVREALDAATLYVQPSSVEGLPRATLEAAARGLPAIGTRVGGIPEIVPEEAIIEIGDVDALAQTIERVLQDPVAYDRLAARCYDTAKGYHRDILMRTRARIYRTWW